MLRRTKIFYIVLIFLGLVLISLILLYAFGHTLITTPPISNT